MFVLLRKHRLLEDYIAQLTRAGVKTYEVNRNKINDRGFDGVRSDNASC